MVSKMNKRNVYIVCLVLLCAPLLNASQGQVLGTRIFQGKRSTDVDCAINVCENEAKCIRSFAQNSDEDFHCVCKPGFKGKYCGEPTGKKKSDD